jgi:beta-lactam-binding protein with PASTA domain
MVLPIVGIAAGVAARAAAKKAATSAVKKVATKKAADAATKATAKKRVAATYTPTKKAVPAKVVKKTTPPIYKNSQADALLEQQYAKVLKITKARGGDPKKVSVTIDGRTIDYKGIR